MERSKKPMDLSDRGALKSVFLARVHDAFKEYMGGWDTGNKMGLKSYHEHLKQFSPTNKTKSE